MAVPRHPALYQINTRVWLHELGVGLGRAATLDDVPEASIEKMAAEGFDWVWLLGVWPDTLQLNYRHKGFRAAMAEAYWDLEWTLQQQGFDYTYDKRYYDRLHAQEAGAVRGHLQAAPEYQRRSARFLENYDEPRAAAVFPAGLHQAAAVLAFLVPGLRFLHEGQCSGRRRRTSNHLRRRAAEPVDRELESFYNRLLACMRRPEVRNGAWRLLDAQPAWDGNPTWERFLAFCWEDSGRRLLVTVNYGPTRGQCYVRLPHADFGGEGHAMVLSDLLNPATTYERNEDDLQQRGLYLDMPAWGYHVFEMSSTTDTP